MNRDEAARLRSKMAELREWSAHAEAIRAHRAWAQDEAERALADLRQSVADVTADASVVVRVLPLATSDLPHLEATSRAANLSAISDETADLLERLTREVPPALHQAGAGLGLRRIFSSATTKRVADTAADLLAAFHEWATGIGVAQRLDAVDDRARSTPSPTLREALDARVGIVAAVPGAELVSADVLRDLPASLRTVTAVLQEEARTRGAAREAADAVRSADAEQLLRQMPLERLRDASSGSIRIQPLVDARYASIDDVLRRAAQLESLPGIGATSAGRIRAAALALAAATRSEVVVRIDGGDRSPASTLLLERLQQWDRLRRLAAGPIEIRAARGLEALAERLHGHEEQLVVTPVAGTVASLAETVDIVLTRAEAIAHESCAGHPDAWEDFASRPADFFSMLDQLGILTGREASVSGDLPDDLVERVRAFTLDTRRLNASLRGYQAFAARFSLVQRKVVIGDEMGLGKTVEALAVLAHLHAGSGRHAPAKHSLVVCPAAVVTNWMRETAEKTDLDVFRLHGPARLADLRAWTGHGGIAVTTYETLRWLEPHLARVPALAAVIVDEAHYIKNPGVIRSTKTAALVAQAGHAVLLTGTPLENRIDEFRTLVRYVRPDLVVNANDHQPRLFRKQVAAAYLRRSQEDVLAELPELVEVDEWTPMSDADLVGYRAAVASGNFHDMRRAPLVQGVGSGKVQRLLEIVEEASANDRKVLIFSNYLDVLAAVQGCLRGEVIGPLTGAVPAERRQGMVDEFSDAGPGAVLLSQIQAGGVGLNVQAASVVVICEPQVKPTTEWQAIARAHRMGQLRSVQVHRLLSEVGADLALVRLLRQKAELFADFAAISDTAAASPEALDVTTAEMVKQIVAEEQERLFGEGAAEFGRAPAMWA